MVGFIWIGFDCVQQQNQTFPNLSTWLLTLNGQGQKHHRNCYRLLIIIVLPFMIAEAFNTWERLPLPHSPCHKSEWRIQKWSKRWQFDWNADHTECNIISFLIINMKFTMLKIENEHIFSLGEERQTII